MALRCTVLFHSLVIVVTWRNFVSVLLFLNRGPGQNGSSRDFYYFPETDSFSKTDIFIYFEGPWKPWNVEGGFGFSLVIVNRPSVAGAVL